MSTVYGCRGCRNPIHSGASCALCQGFKKNLVLLGDSPVDDGVDLGDMATETLRLQQSILRGLRLQQKALPQGAPVPAELLRAVNSLSRTIANMVDATRKVRQEGVAAMQGMSFQDKLDLFIGWLEELTPVHRKHVFAEMQAADAQIDRPALGVLSGGDQS